MIKKLSLTLLAAIPFLMCSCGSRVEVPTAHVGKVKTAAGLEEGIKHPSSFRLPFAVHSKPELILLETSHFPVNEQIVLFMPKDKLNLTFDVRGTMFVVPEKSDELFGKLVPQGNGGVVSLISSHLIYTTYGQQLIRSRVRAVMSKYTIEEVMNNRESVNAELSEEIVSLFSDKSYPLGVIQFGLADIQPPAVIVKAQESAKEREVAIQTAEAQKAVALTEAGAALEVAQKQQEIDLLEAETQVLVEEKLSTAVNERFIAQRALRVLEDMANNPNKTFVISSEVLKSPQTMIGVNNKIFNQ